MSGRCVLLVASEAYPLAKTGGLGDCVGGLAKALDREGCVVRVLLPGYPEALDRLAGRVGRLDLGDYPGLGHVALVHGEMPGSAVKAWLIDCPTLYRRPGGLYQDEDGNDWQDNAQRFALLARVGARLALARGPLAWRPEIVHLNDWQTGPLATILAQERDRRPPCIFTVHNLAFQGLFGPEALDALGLSRDLLTADGLEFWGRASFLKAGIRFADRVTTVSETYAREMLTPAFGCGLDGALRTRPDKVIGIRNGVDEDEWNPATDRHLPATYHLHDLTGKAVCKAAGQARFGLEHGTGAPVLAYLCRLTDQKMADVVLAALPDLIARGFQLVVMGCGDRTIEAAFQKVANRFVGRVGVVTDYDEPRAHLLVAAADMLLAPARFEPCGLTQMYAMRYGTVPVASRVGGLAETITDLPSESFGVGEATGFLFDEVSAPALVWAVERAIASYRQPFLWRRLVANGMRRDFSWARSARRYVELYETLALMRTPGSPEPPLHLRLIPQPRRATSQESRAAAASCLSKVPDFMVPLVHEGDEPSNA